MIKELSFERPWKEFETITATRQEKTAFVSLYAEVNVIEKTENESNKYEH